MAYGGSGTHMAIGTTTRMTRRPGAAPRHMAGESPTRAMKVRRSRKKVQWKLPIPARRKPESDPYAVYYPLPRLMRPLFPEAPYDRCEYLSAVEGLFNIAGVTGVLLTLTGGISALVLLMQGEFFLALMSAGFAWLVWLVANVARDVLKARYRAVLAQERGARQFEAFMVRPDAGRRTYRDSSEETGCVTPSCGACD